MCEDTRVILPHLPLFGGPAAGNDAGGGETIVTRIRHVNTNKRIMTGLASSGHPRRPTDEHVTASDSHNTLTVTAADIRGRVSPSESTGFTLMGAGTGVHYQEQMVCLPAIEVSDQSRNRSTPKDNASASLKRSATTSPLGGGVVTMGAPITSASDAAYIRSRSATPSLLGAPRDLLPRSKKTSLFAGYLPDLPQSQDETRAGGNLALTIEGHHDLTLPPKRNPTEPRKVEKSKHRMSALSSILDGSITDVYISLEEDLKALLMCQSMGIHLEVAGKQGQDAKRSVRPVFHCLRCLKHWMVYGTTRPDCSELEQPAFGPTFEITQRSHEIIREFESLSHEDKRKVVDVIVSCESAAISFEERDGVDVTKDIETVGRETRSTLTRSPRKSKPLDKSDVTFGIHSPSKTTCTQLHVDSETLLKSGVHGKTKDQEMAVDSKTPEGDTKTRVDATACEDPETSVEPETVVSDTQRHTLDRQAPRTTDQAPRMTDQEPLTTDQGPQKDFLSKNLADSQDVSGKHPLPNLNSSQGQSEEAGQYAPDGAYYPGYYAQDGRFMATCRITPDGHQRQPVVMGPDGRFYANARYTADGRFHLGEDEADKHGVLFLSADEMAELKANRPHRQGVVGPDGLFYPNGFYQSDGTFVTGGPPHSGHPQVWGPILGGTDQKAGYNFPPTHFGPAWPPDAPAPYTDSQQYTLLNDDKNQLLLFSDEQVLGSTTHGQSKTSAVSPVPASSIFIDNHESFPTDPADLAHYEHVDIADADKMKELYSEGSSLDQDEQIRDLFSPWGKDDDLPNLSITASVTLNEDRRELDDERSRGHESCDLDELSQDVPLCYLDNHIMSDIMSEEEATQNQNGGEKTSAFESDLLEPLKLDGNDDKETGINEIEDTKSKTLIGPKKRRDVNTTYMGITDSNNRNSDSSHTQIENSRRGSLVSDTRRGSKAVMKAGKNPAVKNVTGKPETKPGMLQKHMFATPSTTLTHTNIMGIKNKRSSRDVDVQSGTTKSTDNVTAASKDTIQARKPKLPAIGGGEPPQDDASRKSPSPTKQLRQSISRIGSGEKRKLSHADSILGPPEETVKPRSGKAKLPKVKKKKAKEARKTVGKRQEGAEVEELKINEDAKVEEQNRNEIKRDYEVVDKTSHSKIDQTDARVHSPVKPAHDTKAGTYQDLLQDTETRIKELNIEERVSTAKLSGSSSILEKFSEFRVSMPTSTSPMPTEHAPSFRMTYSTLPNFGVKEPQSMATSKPTEDVLLPERKPSKSKSIPFDFEKVEKGYDIRARTSSTRSLLNKKSSTGTKMGKLSKSKKSRRRSGSISSDMSDSSRASSAESVWESISEIWKRHKAEMTNLEKCVADSYLPLTHAFTFSMFPLAPGYAAHNKRIWERAAAIKQLRQPIHFKKFKRTAKPMKKRSTTIGKSTPLKTTIDASKSETVAPVK